MYVLRHCTPADSDLPNRERPLSDIGHRQAQQLVPVLTRLGISAVYTSPFRRALETVAPFCNCADIRPIEKEELGESAEDERLPQVRSRLIGALNTIAEDHDGECVLVCTHGGCLWGAISQFDTTFGYEDYRRIGCPGMRRIVYTAGKARLDQAFELELPTA